jgi:hypothetical protein
MSDLEMMAGPLSAQRQEVYEQMPESLREIAVQMQREFTTGTRKIVHHFHRIGTLVDSVLTDASNHYGAKALEKLEIFLNVRGATLRDYRSFARAFPDINYVVEQQNKLTASGLSLSVYHWVYAARLDDPREQKAVIEKAVREGMTANELLEYVSGVEDRTTGSSTAGRSPKPPTTPVAGVTRIGKLAQKLNNYITDVADDYIFDPLSHLSPDVVTSALSDTLVEARDKLVAMLESSQAALKSLNKSLERVNRIVATHPAEVPDDEVDVARHKSNPVAQEAAEPKKVRRPRAAKRTPTGT